MKIFTSFGQKEVKIKKQFDILDEKFCIVDFPFKYMNSEEPMEMRCVVHYKTGQAIHFLKAHHRQTLKDFEKESIIKLHDLVKQNGEEKFREELNRFEVLNN
jgi:hypothetical protein